MINADARGAWSDLEGRLRPYVARRVASTAEVDDIVQEIFVRVHRGLPGLREDQRFGAWVYRIAAHVIADSARSRARDPLVPVRDLPEPVVAAGDDERHVQAELESSLVECVALFVARLPSPYREAITLTELQGISQRDAADLLGASLPALKSRVQRGRDKLRAMFEQCCRISLDCRGHVRECEPRAATRARDPARDPADDCAASRRS